MANWAQFGPICTLHCSKVSFLQCCHIRKDIIKYLQKCELCTHFCEILYIVYCNNCAKVSSIFSNYLNLPAKL